MLLIKISAFKYLQDALKFFSKVVGRKSDMDVDILKASRCMRDVKETKESLGWRAVL